MHKRVHILGIRHHGPGSAKSLEQFLTKLQPDIILIEGPPEGEALLEWADHKAMQPPVALLLYPEDTPEKASYYPFAVFSPEWRAIQFGAKQKVPVRFMDLSPTWHWPKQQGENKGRVYQDPLSEIAKKAGFPDGETWWDALVEQTEDTSEIFEQISLLMGEVRKSITGKIDLETLRREAYMRQQIRKALKEGHQRIAVVCGAYHAPVLEHLPPAKEDTALLKGIKKPKTAAVWVPWTYARLSFQSGYGAGILSPEWYDMVFHTPKEDLAMYWMLRVAGLLRDEGLDASPAQGVEAVRLAETLAVMRGKARPHLPELMQTIQTVYCFGASAPLKLVRKKLIIGERMGSVPDTAPLLPLQIDIQKRTKTLRLAGTTSLDKPMKLDLRKPFHLDKSQFLHRLNLLDIPWGTARISESITSTFHEHWDLDWQPELEINIIEASAWGNTVLEACLQKIHDETTEGITLPAVTILLGKTFLAGIQSLLPFLISRMRDLTSEHTDTQNLMEAFPPLVKMLRYGSVRKTDKDEILSVIDILFPKMSIGMTEFVTNLNEERGEHTFKLFQEVHQSVQLLPENPFRNQWQLVLEKISDSTTTFPKIRGYGSRMLFDFGKRGIQPTATAMSFALSPGSETEVSAQWLEGFLHGSGQLLIHNPGLWQILDTWVSNLDDEIFQTILPLIRRTFSQFSLPERKKLGLMAKGENEIMEKGIIEWDEKRGEKVLPILGLILGKN